MKRLRQSTPASDGASASGLVSKASRPTKARKLVTSSFVEEWKPRRILRKRPPHLWEEWLVPSCSSLVPLTVPVAHEVTSLVAPPCQQGSDADDESQLLGAEPDELEMALMGRCRARKDFPHDH